MKRTKGFTLIELLVVIAIMGVLIAILAPAISSTRERASIASCINNMKQLTMAAFMYADDHGSVIPDVPDTSAYAQNEVNIYKCPRDTRSGVGIAKPSYTAWQYTPASLLPAGLNGLSSELILYLESDQAGIKDKAEIKDTDIAFRHDNRTVIVFADGHVFSYGEAQLSALVTGSTTGDIEIPEIPVP
ncbi:MAG: prepilin-type N-terminal cleavage/methylation domain-containing protein [Candidatus Omnitrophica bacterium]|nr:prepilin-type N-terminal cleavage/methylation domain-containing protein [Candidatus Omnitrophota bacterium]